MDRRSAAGVTDAIASWAAAVGDPATVIASATDLSISESRARLDGVEQFDLAEVLQIGGFLHVRPSVFFEGVTA